MKRDELLEQVKQTVHEIEPDADITLYGSRARGDAHSESDWDFLILLDGVVDDARTDAISLGRALAKPLQYVHFDTDDYFWLPTDPPFTQKRERIVREQLLMGDLTTHGS